MTKFLCRIRASFWEYEAISFLQILAIFSELDSACVSLRPAIRNYRKIHLFLNLDFNFLNLESNFFVLIYFTFFFHLPWFKINNLKLTFLILNWSFNRFRALRNFLNQRKKIDSFWMGSGGVGCMSLTRKNPVQKRDMHSASFLRIKSTE